MIGARASSLDIPPFKESFAQSQAFVRGHVKRAQTEYGKGSDGVRRIYSYYELEVDESFKGLSKSTRRIFFRVLGGEKDGQSLHVSGAPGFKIGEDVVVALGPKNPDGSRDLRDMSAGKYSVARDGAGNEFLEGIGIGPQTLSSDRWTLAKVRDLANGKNPAPAPSSAPSPSVSPEPSAVASVGASAKSVPQTVTEDEAGPPPSIGGMLAWAVGSVILLALLIVFLMRRP